MNRNDDAGGLRSADAETTPTTPLDVGPLGVLAIHDTSFARALAGFRTRLAAFGLGSLPSPILASGPAAGRWPRTEDQAEND